MECVDISKTNLDKCSYRFLQQTAKAMGLPSNVKKVYLVQLIYTMKYRSKHEVDKLVEQVRQERQQVALVRRKINKNQRKKHVQQSTEISSTSNSLSPPITKTPKRTSHVVIRYSPENHSPIKQRRPAPPRKYPLGNSDRVLRSFNKVKKPSYLINNSLMSLLKASGTEQRSETKVHIVSKEEKVHRTYMRKNTDMWRNGGELVPILRSGNISPRPQVRAKRLLSGIYPLHPEEIKVPNVAVRHADGSLSKLKAIIQKPLAQYNYNCERQTDRKRSLLSIEQNKLHGISVSSQTSNYRPSISDITPHSDYRVSNITDLTSNLEFRTPNLSDITPSLGFRAPNLAEISQNLGYKSSDMVITSVGYTANSSLTDNQNSFNFSSSSEEINLLNAYKENCSQAVYYHKKIRAEQVRSLRSREPTRGSGNENYLPKINEVFSKFRDVTQPIYVQVDNEPDIAPNSYIPEPRVLYQGDSVLEKLYNLKSVHQPLLQISTTTNTHTVYCTPVISTAKAQPSSTAVHDYNCILPRDSQPYFLNDDEEIPRVHDFFRNFRCEENEATLGFRGSSSSAETMTSQEQELGANVTIPEMVEDALEIISQDGDYMERMGMDIRMQCILCNWAGPKIILEYHIRKEHSADIIECQSNEWCATYTLGWLASGAVWLSQVLEHHSTLYVLSAKYEDPDYFTAALSRLSTELDSPKTGSMTIYNKVTGQPFTWQGEITQLPPSMPYDNDHYCLKLQLSQLDLLPNSANLRLVNRELVVKSPTKVIVGQPELDNINICLVVKIFD